MNAYLPLFVEAMTSLEAGLAVLYTRASPLLDVPARICPDKEAA